MTKVEKYTQEAIAIANDNSHGYSQANRNGNPDYDCSSLVCNVVQRAGIPVMDRGASYTGNMRSAFLACGFYDVTSSCNLSNADGMKRGDILLNDANHVAIYTGDRKIVHARGSDGHPEPGDQSGREIVANQNYWNFPWNAILRYPQSDEADNGDASGDDTTEAETVPFAVSTNNPDYPTILKFGDIGGAVRDMQTKLNDLGFPCGVVDGDFGKNTLAAVMRFQERYKLEVDGEAGPITLGKIRELCEEEQGESDQEETIEEPAKHDDASVAFAIGEIVKFCGDTCYLSSWFGFGMKCNPGLAKVTAARTSAIHPYHVVAVSGGGSDVVGWVDKKSIKKNE